MNRSSLTIVLYLLLVFVSGVAVGAFGFHLYSAAPVYSGSMPSAKTAAKKSPEEWRREYLTEMQARVHLTQAQSRQLNGILDATRTLFHESREKHNREVQALRDDQANRIRAILTEEQRPEYEVLRAEREQRAKNSKK